MQPGKASGRRFWEKWVKFHENKTEAIVFDEAGIRRGDFHVYRRLYFFGAAGEQFLFSV